MLLSLHRNILIVATLLLTDSIVAQEDTITLSPVEVSVTRGSLGSEIPAATFTLEKEDIQRLNSLFSLEESLREVPGLFVNNRFNLSQGERISIRGLGSRAQYGVRSIKFLLDGIPLTFPDGTTQLNNLDLSYAGNVEVLRGPASALYGNSAGGVIYIQTERPEPGEVTLTPGVVAGSYGYWKPHLQLALSKGNFSVLASASATNFNGYREFSNARIYHANSVIKYFISTNTTLTAVINATHAPYMLNPGGMSRTELEQDRQKVRQVVQNNGASKEVQQGQVGLSLSSDLKKWGYIRSSIYGISRDLYNPIFGRIIDLERVSLGTRNEYNKQFRLQHSLLNLTAGFDIEYQNDDRREFENDGIPDVAFVRLIPKDVPDLVRQGSVLVEQQEQVTTYGIFSALGWNYNRFELTAAGRYDHFVFEVERDQPQSVQFSEVSPSVGIGYQFAPNWKGFANYSTAFQTPTANEFSNDSTGSGFNRDLKPEQVQSLEAGVKKAGEKISAQVAAFYFTVEDQIIPYQGSIFSDETFYRNAGRTSNKGAELWLKYKPFQKWHFTLSYTFMDYVFEDYVVQQGGQLHQLAGSKVPGVPQHRLFFSTGYLPEKGFQAEVDLQYVGRYFANDFNGVPPGSSGEATDHINKGYLVVDAKLGYQLELRSVELIIFGGVNNLLNATYNSSIIPNAAGSRYFEPALPMNFYAGLRVPVRITGSK